MDAHAMDAEMLFALDDSLNIINIIGNTKEDLGPYRKIDITQDLVMKIILTSQF